MECRIVIVQLKDFNTLSELKIFNCYLNKNILIPKVLYFDARSIFCTLCSVVKEYFQKYPYKVFRILNKQKYPDKIFNNQI